jgi:transposase
MLTPLLPLPVGLRITSVEAVSDVLTVTIDSCTPVAACPLCGEPSERTHSRYQRTLADLPVAGQRVRLLLTVRRFFCDYAPCPRQIFAEQFPDLTQPRSRMTGRLVAALQTIGLAANGEAGARLATQLGMPVSPTTLLRRVMDIPPPSEEPVEVVGIDDFAFRRGHTYGTILVNLVTATVAHWLRCHPEVRIISRDRSLEYAQAARKGAPQAIQVADRFHLMANLIETIDPLVTRCLKEIRRSLLQPRSLIPAREALRQEHLGHNQVRFDAVMQLHQQHLTHQAIAEQLGMSARTVRRWLKRGIRPDGQRRRRRSRDFNPHEAYVQERWQQGCHDIRQLTQEVRQRGFAGCQRTVYRFVERMQRLPTPQLSVPPASLARDLTVRQVKWLLVQPHGKLSASQQHLIKELCVAHPTLQTLYELVQFFGKLVRHREGERLAEWQEAAQASGLSEVARFALGLDRDRDAVIAGLTLVINNGMVEGFVNKLKLLKRQGYGQAGFALLRQRILHSVGRGRSHAPRTLPLRATRG